MTDTNYTPLEIAAKFGLRQHENLQISSFDDNEKHAIAALYSFVLLERDFSDNSSNYMYNLYTRLTRKIQVAVLDYTIDDAKYYAALIEEDHQLYVILFLLFEALTDGFYHAGIRVALQKLCCIFHIDWDLIMKEEDKLAKNLQTSIKDVDNSKNDTVSSGRWWKIGLGTLAGGTAFALSGSLAAPRKYFEISWNFLTYFSNYWVS